MTDKDALEWFDDLLDDMCCGNCQPLEIKCIQSQPQCKTIRQALQERQAWEVSDDQN